MLAHRDFRDLLLKGIFSIEPKKLPTMLNTEASPTLLSLRFLMSCFVGGSMLLWDAQCIFCMLFIAKPWL
jgi:hypothetical protein